mgnify:CR=1 FL=1
MIHFKNISKSFGKNLVLQNVDLQINTPGIFALLGPNGSGKTTLIKTFMGMVCANSGEILFNQQVVSGNEYRKKISYLPQIARFPENLTPLEFFDFIEKLRGPAPRKEELIHWFNIEAFLHKTLRNLSGGTRQKINLVSCLMYNNPVLILDEPSTGLDPVAMLKLKKWILAESQQGKQIILCSHLMDFVQELADEVIFMLDGEVHYRGNQHQLLAQTNTQTLEEAIANLLSEPKAQLVC